MNTKIKFLARVLVLTLFLTFISCNDELYDIKEQHNGVDKNKISLTQFKNETNINQVEPILSVPTKTSITSKTKVQLSDFVIDTLAIKKFISENNKTTYTFRIYPLSFVAQPNEIYNLVYRKVNTSWETAIFYIKKNPEENSEHKLFEKIERIDGPKVKNVLTSKSTFTTLNAGSGMCSYETVTIHCDGSCELERKIECDGFACRTGQCIRRSVTYLYCDSGGGAGGYYDPGANSGGGGPGGNGSTNSGAPTGNSALEPFTYFPNDFSNLVYEDPMYVNTVKRAYIWDNLGVDMERFFVSNQEYLNYFNETIQYQKDNNWSPESNEMGNWAREYKYNNPNTSWSQFQNWFMGSSEGNDGGEVYDPSDYEGVNIAKQTLPGRNAFYNAFPKVGASGMPSDHVYELVGGHMWEAHKGNDKNYQNACAIRVSRALNYSGKPIPVFINNKGKQKTEKGKDGLNYILDASSLLAYMLKAFPDTPPLHLKNKTPDEYQKALNGKWGIYIMVPKSGFGASGHADFYSQSGCLSGCYFSDAAEIYFWELK